MKTDASEQKPDRVWQTTQYTNLIRYVPSGVYFARFRVLGKLIRKSLKTDVLTVAKLRLADLEKAERQRASSQANVARGKLTFGEAIIIYKERLQGNVSLKEHSKDYYLNRLIALSSYRTVNLGAEGRAYHSRA